MERVLTDQSRLALPEPYLLFHGIPPQAEVDARVHGWRNAAAQLYEIDYGVRPAAYNVPPGGTPPATAAALRVPQSLALLGQGGPVAPGPREDEYAYQYVWAPFAPAVQGAVVPHGKLRHAFAMPFVPPNDEDDKPVLRFRWRGNVVKAAWDTLVAGTGVAGPYTIDLTGGGANVMPIIPGTVRILAPIAVGPVVTVEARDWPWPTAEERKTCVTGRMIGDVDPNVDSVINYETGQVVITFNQNIVAGPPNITADFEHDGTLLPIDIRVTFDINQI